MRKLFWGLVGVTLLASPASARQLMAEKIVQGLTQPVAFVQNPALPGVQHIVLKEGRIRTLQNGVLLDTPFLDIRDRVYIGPSGESGLLSLAFAPDYATSGRFFVHYSNHPAGNAVIARFHANNPTDLQVDPGTEFALVWPDGNGFVTQPADGHEGGNLAFGPDGMLYIAFGDGSEGNDPDHNAQNPQVLLGKMLRVDVNVSDSDPEGYDVPVSNPFYGSDDVLWEIWAFGLRNPWRWSFDPWTGALIIADVGQYAWEEINYQPAGQGGRNYGWRNREGAHDNVTELPPFYEPLREPTFEFAHTEAKSIIGGVVYRGTALGSQYVGRYFFADFVYGHLWSLSFAIDPQTGEATAHSLLDHSNELLAGADAIVSFGVDAAGEMYTVSYSGMVYRIQLAAVQPPPPPPPPTPSTCATPDPFVAMGGGTCVGGGWYPPGVVPPNPTPPTDPNPPPPPPPPPPTGGDGSCATPDPFAAMGGGTCYQGGWLPPGMTPPTPVNPPPPPPPPPPSDPGNPPPPPPPPPVDTSCAGPDPFAAMGGGTCYQGGWLPPGMLPPTNPPPPPPPVSGGCITPDPFVILGGGKCINGGWHPPGSGD